MKASSIVKLVLCLALCFGVGAVGGFVTYPEIPTWYAGLAKPSWTPPSVVFPVVWNLLYLLMAISLWLLWQAPGGTPLRGAAIALFLVQLALNAAWSPVFFALHRTGLALVIIALLALAVIATIRAAWRVRPTAGLLLLPYLAWILYASTLNAGIMALNP